MTSGIEEAACQEHPGIIFGSKCLKIEANGEFLLHPRQLKDRIGSVESSNPNYNADLRALGELFGLSVIGSSKGYQTFENHLRAKYNAAVTFHCANTLGKHITEISWKGGSPEAKEIEACLDTYPGTVHIWATIEDMQALFSAREGVYLSYLESVSPEAPMIGWPDQTYYTTNQPSIPFSYNGTNPSMPDSAESLQPDLHSQAYQWPILYAGRCPVSSIPPGHDGGFDIAVDYNNLTCVQTWKGAANLADRGGIPDGSLLKSVFDKYFLSEKGKNFENARTARSTFEAKLMAKYKMAVNAAYASDYRTSPDEIMWDSGMPETLQFGQWLENNPGTVHVRVDEEDMHAEFRPAQAGLFWKSQF